MGALSGINFAQLASQYSPDSAMYKELLGVVNNPGALNNPAIAASIAGSLQYPAMPDVTGTMPNGQQATIPYNVAAPSYLSNLRLNGTGTPGYLQSAPDGSAAMTATPNLTPAPTPPPAVPGAPATGAPAASGTPDQPAAPGGFAAVGSGDPGAIGSPDPSAAPGGFSSVGGGLNPLASLYSGGNIPSDRSANGIGSQSYTPQSNPNNSQINFGSILSGLGQNLNLGNVLPAALGIGAGLWQYLGSDAAFSQAGNLINNAETGAGNEVNSTAQTAASGVTGAAGQGNNLLSQLLSYYNGQTAPYQAAGSTAAGTLNTDLAPGGTLNSNLTADQVMQNDPGYQFRLGQGLQGVQSKLAAEGLGDSGAAAKELEQYGQDYASSQYQQAFQNQQTQQQNLFGRLYGTSGLGLTGTGQGITSGEAFGAPQASNLLSAANSAGGFGLAGSQYQGNANVTGAGAQAGAVIDANQQKNAMIQQILTSLMSLFGRQGPDLIGDTGTINNGGIGGLPPGTLPPPYNPTGQTNRYQPA